MNWYLIFAAWLIASTATLVSLFFSEVMLFMPCVLCWYQRIAMYPLVLILLLGLFPLDPKVVKYSLGLSISGLVISVYHSLLHLKIIPESAMPCVQGVPCSTVYINWLGFITIPILSMVAFALITALLFIVRKNSNEN